MFGRKTRERVAGKATLGVARGAGKAALGAGKVVKGGAKSRTARKATGKAARGASRVALKGGKQVASPGKSAGFRFLRYGFFAIAGFVVGALVARSSSREDASTFTGTTDQRGEAWGSGTPTGAAGGVAGTVSDPTRPESPQRPEDPNRTGMGPVT